MKKDGEMPPVRVARAADRPESALSLCISFFFFNHTAPTEIYTLSLHDALPISGTQCRLTFGSRKYKGARWGSSDWLHPDRKSTRLNSSHGYISYAVFCLKK